jgi:uncharacterized protein
MNTTFYSWLGGCLALSLSLGLSAFETSAQTSISTGTAKTRTIKTNFAPTSLAQTKPKQPKIYLLPISQLPQWSQLELPIHDTTINLSKIKPSRTERLISDKPKISIVVDDLGDNSVIAGKMIDLPAPLTLAILPHTPFASQIARKAIAVEHEVIMHLPMEALSRPDLLGPGALLANMLHTDFSKTFLTSAKTIPHMVGFNNHMGSLLTQDIEKMQWLMTIAQQNNWYFLDSKTSGASIAQTTASSRGVPTIGRDIFLDHHTNKAELPKMLSQQFERLKLIAKKRGHVVVICHPYPETVDFLNRKLPELQQEFELVRLSELI